MSTLRTMIISLAVLAMFIEFAVGADFIVGAPGGSWDLATNMDSWAKSQTFSVGDNLIFQYTAQHSVLEVTKSDYDSCLIDNSFLTDSSGNTTILLSSAGKRYFICGSIGHCGQGMKLEVDIVASATPSPPPPARSPPPASSTPTPPTPARSPPPASSTPKPPTPSESPKPTATPSTPTSTAPSESPNSPTRSPSDQSPPPQPPSNSGNKGQLEVNLAVVLGFGTVFLLAL